MNASAARAQLFPLIEQVNADQEAVEITSKNGTAFLVSADEYRSLRETAYLLRSPANAAHLKRALEDVAAKRIEGHDLHDAG